MIAIVSGTPQDLLQKWVGDTRPDWSPTRIDLVLRRLGWVGTAAPSLEEIGAQLGISRQSAHEMTNRLLDSLAPIGDELREHLEQANAAMQSLDLPLHAGVVTEVLRGHLGDGALSAAAVISVMEAAGMHTSLRIERDYVLRIGQTPPDIDDLIARVTRLIHLHGFLDARLLGREIELPDGVALHDVIQVLEQNAGFICLEDGLYVVGQPGRRSRLVSNIEKMLTVTSPMRLPQLAGGLDRQTRAGRLSTVPEDEVLASLIKAVGFVVVENLVDSEQSFEAEKTLSHVERLLYEWLKPGDSKTAHLKDRAKENGVPDRTLVHFLSYSPIIESRGRGKWGLRGKRVEHPQSAQSSPQIAYSWTAEGELAVSALVTSSEGVVVRVPESVRAMLDNRRFTSVSGKNVSINNGQFLLKPDQYSERRVGDWVQLRFDLASSSVRVD